MSRKSKLVLNKVIIKPIWTYGIELWGATAKTNTDIIKISSKHIDADCGRPRQMKNKIIRSNLKIPSVRDETKKYSESMLTGYQSTSTVLPEI